MSFSTVVKVQVAAVSAMRGVENLWRNGNGHTSLLMRTRDIKGFERVTSKHRISATGFNYLKPPDRY